MNWLKRLFCKHKFTFMRNIYGDEIIARNWKRSLWQCSKCGKWQWRAELNRGVIDLDALAKSGQEH